MSDPALVVEIAVAVAAVVVEAVYSSMQLSVVDHPRVLARGSPKPVNSFSATAAASIHVYKQQFRDSRAVPWAFGRKSLPANNARTLFRSETSELRCAAGKSEQSQQDVRAELQCQVDRLTNLLGDLQAATTWHDKVGRLPLIMGITASIHSCQTYSKIQCRCWLCKMNQAFRNFSVLIGMYYTY